MKKELDGTESDSETVGRVVTNPACWQFSHWGQFSSAEFDEVISNTLQHSTTPDHDPMITFLETVFYSC